MNIIWTKNLPEEKREGFNKQVYASRHILQRLQEILDEDLLSIERQLDSEDFNSDWAFKQAFRNGQKKALRRIKELLNT